MIGSHSREASLVGDGRVDRGCELATRRLAEPPTSPRPNSLSFDGFKEEMTRVTARCEVASLGERNSGARARTVIVLARDEETRATQ
mgnify:CR=1 FL=1